MNRPPSTRAARLRRSTDIKIVRTRGRVLRKDSFTVRAARSAAELSRIAVIAPRSVGSAVMRNRARRRVREAFQNAMVSADAGPAFDVVVTVRPDAVRADFRAIAADARASLADLAG